MSSSISALANPRIFYGWFVVAAAFAVTFVGFGCAYTFSAFVGSLQQDFGASRGSVSLVFSLAGFLYFGLGSVSGPLADRCGSRPLAIAGMILTGIGLAVASTARSLPEVYAAYGLGVGLGVGCSYVPAVGAVQRWFVRRRGFASGLAVSGIGVGTLVMPPLASLLIEVLGWRDAYLVLGGLAAVVGGGMAVMIENDPRDRGVGPDGGPLQSGLQSVRPVGTPVRQAITSRRFVGLYTACLMCSFGLFVPFAHLVPYALDHGIPPSSAVVLLGVIGVGSTGGRFSWRPGRPDGSPTRAAGDVYGHGARAGRLGVLHKPLGARRLRACLWRVLRRVCRTPSGAGHGLFWRTQRQRYHRNSLYQRGVRHLDRSERRGVRLRLQPQLRVADICHCLRQHDRCRHLGGHVEGAWVVAANRRCRGHVAASGKKAGRPRVAVLKWRARRDSNSRPLPSEGSALSS
jgi:MFS family permease